MQKLTLEEADKLFRRLPASVHLNLQRAVKASGEIVKQRAQDKIGYMQPAVGPFNEWAALKPATLEDKARLGLGGSGWPLYRTGEMRRSIGLRVDGLTAHIGSDDEKLEWQDRGTLKIPPRPVLGPALLEKRKDIHGIIIAALVRGLKGAR